MINTSMDRHVAVLAFPFATHAGLLLGLLRRLASAAPNITFSFFSTAKSNASIFSVPTPENIKAYDVPDGVPEGYVFLGRPQEDIDLFLKVAPENFRTAVERAEEEIGSRVSCVVADAFLWFSGDMAEEKGVSWVPVWTSAACSLSVHVYTDLIRQTVEIEGIVGREDEILDFIPGFSALCLSDLPSGIISGNLESPFAVMLHKMGQTVQSATALAINSFDELEPSIMKDVKAKFRYALNVGPFNLTSPPPSSNIADDHGCIPWLDNHKARSVAYIGFGTVATPPPQELKAMAEVLEAKKIPFLWSLKDSSRSHLPDGFMKRTNEYGKIVPWAPQVQVLSHDSIGVFINHCGWNSVLESIAAGVPIIGRPFFGDHHLNGWMVENVWKIGIRIKGGVFTKLATVKALELVLFREEGKKMKARVDNLKELALEAVGPNGTSTRNFTTLLEVITQ
ncbi:UDP-glycosyltransferase 78D2 [Abeliophyllum distichum]|uniref:UDP-glycosyltransferase 78D2 n=1 Tax=Abeliophyllum distichum TaxID=126358 RepID=A0ABD1VBT3_9LAMI